MEVYSRIHCVLSKNILAAKASWKRFSEVGSGARYLELKWNGRAPIAIGVEELEVGVEELEVGAEDLAVGLKNYR